MVWLSHGCGVITVWCWSKERSTNTSIQLGKRGPPKNSDGTDDDDNSDDDNFDNHNDDDNNHDDNNGDDDNFDNHNDDDARDGSDHYGWLGMRVRGFPR